jgi:hypothetical protein
MNSASSSALTYSLLALSMEESMREQMTTALSSSPTCSKRPGASSLGAECLCCGGSPWLQDSAFWVKGPWLCLGAVPSHASVGWLWMVSVPLVRTLGCRVLSCFTCAMLWEWL